MTEISSSSAPAAFKRLCVVGGGAWGTALAHLLAENGAGVTLLLRDPDLADEINRTRENAPYLPGVRLAERLIATIDDKAALDGADAVVYAAPAQAARAFFARLALEAPENLTVLLCSKGLERATGAPLSTVLEEAWPGAVPAVLSGPSFAHDVASGLPTAVTLACADQACAERWRASLARPHFRLYATSDVIGAELGGAMKNVLAIAAGAAEGAGLGESARAAAIARGFAEFQKLGAALGARPETMAGLSGLGDLILTATSKASRNMSLGFELGRGRSLAEIEKTRRTVSEGAATAAAIVALAERHGVETPLSKAVADLISGDRTIRQITDELLARPPKREGG
ncbi:MAG: NAD(P)H-dependent glycerol-3-phosphate dehydrogenase [Pseudomonadota bacterium]